MLLTDLRNSRLLLPALFAASIFLGAQTGMADSNSSSPATEHRHSAHTPGGVPRGVPRGVRLSYRYSRMEMDGNRDGTSDVSTAEVLRDFPVSPLNMRMEMHRFGLTHRINDRLTLMAMVPYLKKSMSLVNRRGVDFSTRSYGLGDVEIITSYRPCRPGMGNNSLRCRFSLDAGLSLPTGEINQRDDTPAGNIKLPYPMQLGSGTFDPVFRVGYTDKAGAWSWGVKAKSKLRFGKNSEGYRWGHKYGLSTWTEADLGKTIRAAFWLDGHFRGNIHGEDSELDPAVVPTARTDLRGARYAMASFRLSGMLHGHRLSAQFGWPVYQDLDGPQLEVDYRFMLSWRAML